MRNAVTAFLIARLDEDEHEAARVLNEDAAQIVANHIPPGDLVGQAGSRG
ncbi:MULTISPECIES: hypothetical protein [unclassified Streptomyces]